MVTLYGNENVRCYTLRTNLNVAANRPLGSDNFTIRLERTKSFQYLVTMEITAKCKATL